MVKKPVNRVALRRAVYASVALHVAVAAVCVLVLFAQSDEHKPSQAKIDTRAEVEVRMSMPDVEVKAESPPPKPPEVPQVSTPELTQPQAVETPPAAPTPQPTTPPPAPTPIPAPEPIAPQVVVKTAPQTLPPEIIAKIRLPGAKSSPIIDTDVHQLAGAATPAAVPAIHGALSPNQTVVYVLDCSGSMGASGKFDAARAALVSTLKQQPPTVRFQVIVYTGSATPLLAGNGAALPATEANVNLATTALAKLDARGKSNHVAAVRAASAFRPDVILVLTDADDLDAAALKVAAQTVPLRVGQVTAEGVQRPRELK